MVIGFVPMRSGSKGIPDKNIKIFNGKPLLYWTLNALEKCSQVDRIVVATNCNDITSISQAFGFKKLEVYRRSEDSAKDTATTEQVLLEFLSTQSILREDVIILTQATSPLTKFDDINNALNLFKTQNFNSILSCVPFKRFIWDDTGTPINYDFLQRPRRQDFTEQYVENGALYISCAWRILESQCRISGSIGLYKMSEDNFFELDEPQDWDILEVLHKKNASHLKSGTNFNNIKLVFSDVDGTLTDGGMYYDGGQVEMKRFNTKDGKGFELLRDKKILTGLVTSEITNIAHRRSIKLKLDYYLEGLTGNEKLIAICNICNKLKISLDQVAYIGDDINCFELLSSVGFAACPNNAATKIKTIPHIYITKTNGGDGAFREFAEIILSHKT